MINPTNCNNELLKTAYPNGFYLLSPDGFTLSPCAKKYHLLKDAKTDFDIWKKKYDQQGYYRTSSHHKIPLDNLWMNMILHDFPFYSAIL